MNRSELIKEVVLKGQLSLNGVTNVVDTIMETIAETVHKGESATLVGFSSFVIQERRIHEGHDPAIDDSMLISAKRQAKFRPGSKTRLE